MNCFECAKVNDAVPAAGVCRHCGVGLCLDHLAEARDYRAGGTLYGCGHTMPRARTLRGVPVGAISDSRGGLVGVE
jgi:hypothetical protein